MAEQNPNFNDLNFLTQLFRNYKKRKDDPRKLIRWENRQGRAVAIIKQFNELQEEIEPIQMSVSTVDLDRMNNNFEREKLRIKDEILNLTQQLQEVERHQHQFIQVIRADVEAAERNPAAEPPKVK